MFESIKRALEVLRNPPAPNWYIVKGARPSKDHPLGGFWKRKSHHEFGLAIGPAGEGTYYISFCGPGGCFEKGIYRQNSSIVDDPDFIVIDLNNIEVKAKKKFKRYTRAGGRNSA